MEQRLEVFQCFSVMNIYDSGETFSGDVLHNGIDSNMSPGQASAITVISSMLMTVVYVF